MQRLFTSCFGLGFLPIAPGTWGSLPPAVIFALMCHLGASAALISIVMCIFVLLGAIVCTKFAHVIIEATGKNDPSEVVADEFAGQALTFIAVFTTGTDAILITTAAGFLLFRFFDILKPWPIRRLEKLPKGWGILTDDLLAGVYAAIALQICIKFWTGQFAG
ncbi:MAG: phosphatidylglycerophosphatase A family protein [Planctomycetota bacterium]|jgi:phosphatidylglycerophosphatase A